MNDPRSMMIGWAALLFAAGSGYYFARKDLNERRREQARQGLRGPAMDWKEKIEQSIDASQTPVSSDGVPRSTTAPSLPVHFHASTSPKTPPKAPPEGSSSSS